MPWSRSLRLLAATAAMAAGLTALPGHPARATTATVTTPLEPTIVTLTPSSLSGSTKGTVTVTGTVTNRDSVTWRDIKVLPFIGQQPLTTVAQLDAAAISAPDALVGYRIDKEADDDVIGDLAPGQTKPYTLHVPRSDLHDQDEKPLSQPGVYWFGVHTIATGPSGRDKDADGRARTFLPLVTHPTKGASAQVGLLMPLRRRVRFTADGRIADEARWTASLTTGHLAAAVSFGSTAQALTWLVDPAVLDAVRRLAADNPPRSIAANLTTSGKPAPSASASATPPTSAPAPSAVPDPTDATDPDRAPAQAAAKGWMTRFLQAIRGHQVLELPYGDPDVSALADHHAGLLAQARTQGDAVMRALGVQATPTIAPTSGYLDAKGIALAGNGVTIVSSQALPGSAPPVVDVGGHVLSVTSATVGAGGPGPTDPYAGVALRQRILAEAALLRHGHQPLLVSLPADWQAPASSADFFAPFAADPWVTLSPYTSAAAGATSATVPPNRLVYPATEAGAQVQPDVLASVDELISAGATLDDILPDHRGVATEALDEALTSTSYAARTSTVDASAAGVRSLLATLAQVQVLPPTAVTLSSDSGRFSVTIANNLAEPVRVGLRPVTDSGITVHVPGSVEIDGGATTSVLVTADVHTNGVHQVGLVLTDSTGAPIGGEVTIPVRSAQVSRVIWVFIAVGVGVLFLAIAVRLVRRVRRARRAA